MEFFLPAQKAQNLFKFEKVLLLFCYCCYCFFFVFVCVFGGGELKEDRLKKGVAWGCQQREAQEEEEEEEEEERWGQQQAAFALIFHQSKLSLNLHNFVDESSTCQVLNQSSLQLWLTTRSPLVQLCASCNLFVTNFALACRAQKLRYILIAVFLFSCFLPSPS
jgi:hypothetical protein